MVTLPVAALPADPMEAGVIAKASRRIIPFLLLLYAVAYLDRTNISYAALQMNADLGMAPEQFGLVASIFFLGYFLFEVPSNVALQRFGASRWLGRILISWGVVAILTGLAQSRGQLLGLRFLLGAAEAGFFPGVAFYLARWFPRRHRARAMSRFLLAQIACSLLGAPLSGLLLDHATWHGLAGWRWMIILEGLPAVALGVATLFVLTDDPGKARWLTPAERDWLRGAMAEDDRTTSSASHWATVLRDRDVLYLCFTYVWIVMAIYGITFWMPTIVKGFQAHLTNTEVGLVISIPTLAGAAALILNAWHSDRTMERRWHVVGVVLVGALGFFLLAFTSDPTLSVAWLCLVSVAAYGYIGVWWTIPTSFLSGMSAAVGLAAINSVGNLGGFFGPYVVGALVQWSGTQRAGLIFLGCSFLIGAGLLAAFRPARRR